MHCRSIFVRLCDDFHLVGHHERGVEAKPEVANDIGLILEFLQELFGTRKGYLTLWR
jgi:hypothetical protein